MELGHQMTIGKLAFVVENIVDGSALEHEIGLYYHVVWPASLAPDDLRRGAKWDTGSAGWRSERWALSDSSLLGWSICCKIAEIPSNT